MRSRLFALSCVGLAAACAPTPRHQPSSPPTSPPPSGRIAFAITSPKAGDTLFEGRTYIIRWRAPDTMTINIGAAMGGHDKGLLLDHAPSAPDSLVWAIPVGYVTGFGPASSDAMRLRMENARNPDQWTEAGPFTIRGAE